MTFAELKSSLSAEDAGHEIYSMIEEAFPICRSITGNGFRQTMEIIQQKIPVTVREVPTGTEVFDWTVPNEWNIRDAYVRDSTGKRVIDFQKSNLQVLNYSVPIHTTMPLSDLKKHLFSDPQNPEWIPYRTSYYNETWGFCLKHSDLQALAEGEYEVRIDSTLEPGSLTYGEYYLPGETTDEILISTHSCHPSLCNDNLSGVGLSTFLARTLAGVERRYSYRFLFIPGTIGSITWLALNEEIIPRIKHGLVVACVGDAGPMTYKKSRRGNAEIDRAAIQTLRHSGRPYRIRPFSPYGYDERQYCSPGFDLAVGSLTRTPHGRYREYHTSADNLDFVKPAYLGESYETYLAVLRLLEENHTYVNRNPKCEPQLGRRGIYSVLGGRSASSGDELAMLWVLNQSDGTNSLLDIAERSTMGFDEISNAARLLLQHELLAKTGRPAPVKVGNNGSDNGEDL